jgi:hypothetical protein
VIACIAVSAAPIAAFANVTFSYPATFLSTVGIGTTVPTETLQVNGAIKTTGVDANNETSAAVLDQLSSTVSRLIAWGPNSSTAGIFEIQQLSSSGSAGQVPLYINPSGNVGIGTTNPGAKLEVQSALSSTWGMVVNDTSATNAGAFEVFQSNGTNIGTITNNNNTGVAYNTTSDIRLKENIATTTEGLATLMQIPVVDFNFINDPTQTRQQGFIAQWLYPIYPEAVSTNGTPATGPLGTSTPWEVDYGRITPLIVQAVQDIANISSTFEQNLIAWLGNASNGIDEFFAQVGNFHTVNSSTDNTQQLCLTDAPNDPAPLCVTKSQLAALLSATGATTGQ